MDILNTAGLAERFMPNVKLPKAASMFDILKFSYDNLFLALNVAKQFMSCFSALFQGLKLNVLKLIIVSFC